MIKNRKCLALCLLSIVLGEAPAFAAPDCRTQVLRLLSGANYAGVDELNDHIGALSNIRTIIFDDQHRPYEKLMGLAPLFKNRDASLKAIGTFKTIKEQKWDTKKGNHTVNTKVFEFVSGKEKLLIKVPIEGDSIFMARNPILNVSFSAREAQIIKRETWNGRALILVGPMDQLAFMSASSGIAASPHFMQQLDQIADFTAKINGDVSQILFHPQYIVSKGLNAVGPFISDEELKLVTELLNALGQGSQKMSEDLAQMTLAKEQDYRKMSLEFVLAHKLPSAKDFETLAKLEKKKRNGTIEFGDGDLFIRLLSERPYRLWIKENEGHEYVIERSTLDAPETQISFGPPNKVEGSVKGTAQSYSESGKVETYPIGRLKFPLELIQVRLGE